MIIDRFETYIKDAMKMLGLYIFFYISEEFWKEF